MERDPGELGGEHGGDRQVGEQRQQRRPERRGRPGAPPDSPAERRARRPRRGLRAKTRWIQLSSSGSREVAVEDEELGGEEARCESAAATPPALGRETPRSAARRERLAALVRAGRRRPERHGERSARAGPIRRVIESRAHAGGSFTPADRSRRRVRARASAPAPLSCSPWLAALTGWLLARWPAGARGRAPKADRPPDSSSSGSDRLHPFPEVRLLARLHRIDTSEPDANEIPGRRVSSPRASPPPASRRTSSAARRAQRTSGRSSRATTRGRSSCSATSTSSRPRARKVGAIPPFGGVSRRSVDVRPRHLRHEEPDDRPAPGDDRRRPGAAERPKRSILFLATSRARRPAARRHAVDSPRHPELVARMGVVLTEGGVVEATSADDVKYWGIEFAQKTYAESSSARAIAVASTIWRAFESARRAARYRTRPSPSRCASSSTPTGRPGRSVGTENSWPTPSVRSTTRRPSRA